jgi:SMI1/KNR4 family protein
MTNNFKNKVDSYLSSEVGRLFIRYKNEAKDIKRTEKELGITIDDALKYVLLTYGGAYIGVDLLPCSEDPNNKNQETILDYTKSIRDYYKEINVCHSIQLGYVISIDGNGDIIFIDSENKVKIFYHDTNEEELLAKNFESFIIELI